jgi:ATP-binding cassette subfamily F protein uup
VERYVELSAQGKSAEQSKLELSSLSSRLGKKIIEIDHIGKRYGERILFENFSYNLLRNDRLGIIGPNGCGKSTLLKILRGIVAPDTGTVSIGETVKIGYFSQESEEMDTTLRVIDYIKDISSEIVTPDGTFTASQMLERFLFSAELQYTTIGRLSGGERRRLFLLRILMDAPNVLFLDEPTNDLDIQTLTILEDYLQDFSGAVLVVSHDRFFLDKVVDHIFAFQPGGKLTQYLGGYSDYMEQHKDEEKAMQQSVENGPEKKQKSYRSKSDKLKFSFNEQREYEEIDAVIANLEDEISAVQKEIEAQASNYTLLQELLGKKEELEAALAQKMDRWVYLNDLAEKIENQ